MTEKISNKKITDNFNITIDELISDKTEELKEVNEQSIDVSKTWNEIKLKMLNNISELSYDVWFEKIIKAKVINDEFIIIYPSVDFACMHINEHY